MAKKYAKGYTPDDKVQEVAAKPEEEKEEKIVASNAADLGITTMAEPADGKTEVVIPPSSTDKTEDDPEEVTKPEEPTDPEDPDDGKDDEETPGGDAGKKPTIGWAHVCCAMTVYPKLS